VDAVAPGNGAEAGGGAVGAAPPGRSAYGRAAAATAASAANGMALDDPVEDGTGPGREYSEYEQLTLLRLRQAGERQTAAHASA